MLACIDQVRVFFPQSFSPPAAVCVSHIIPRQVYKHTLAFYGVILPREKVSNVDSFVLCVIVFYVQW